MNKFNFKEAERYPTKAYKLGGITYVPHYVLNGYAYPGIGKEDLPISEQALRAKGAVETKEMLYAAYGRTK